MDDRTNMVTGRGHAPDHGSEKGVLEVALGLVLETFAAFALS